MVPTIGCEGPRGKKIPPRPKESGRSLLRVHRLILAPGIFYLPSLGWPLFNSLLAANGRDGPARSMTLWTADFGAEATKRKHRPILLGPEDCSWITPREQTNLRNAEY